ncbi:hypothetical protein GCM10022247_54920 [Allokutzneria multivorans]|uniref:ABC transmembrane type-1 domain-containing protein n=1 Tax=Allokutzneria multivorans TaxID=1142134 RepID=A0ABP7TCN3_9PSEU
MTSPRQRLNLSGLLTVAALLLLWQGIVAARVIELQYLPAPTEIATAALSLLADGQLLDATAHTLSATVVGWLLALVVGGALGVVLGTWRPARALVAPTVDVLRTLPVVALVPIAVLLLGFSTTMEITVAAWAAAWPIVVNTMGGVAAVHPRLREVAATLHFTPARRIWSIVLPAAAPLVVVGARLGLSISLIVTVIAEMIGNPMGLGHELVQMQQALRPDAMFAAMLVIGMLGVLLNSALLSVSARVGVRGRS